jgi:sec-independent protein translocase protein TatA
MPSIGAPELIIILLIVLVLFGASRLPKLGRSMGQGIKGFKQGLDEGVKDDGDKAIDEESETTDTPDEADKADKS